MCSFSGQHPRKPFLLCDGHLHENHRLWEKQRNHFLHAEKEIRRLDTLLSVENPDSEISRLSKEGKLIPSEDTARLISLAESWNRSTGGTFDISLAPLSKLWGFPHGPYHVPTETERGEALGKTGMKYISHNEETGEYFLKKDVPSTWAVWQKEQLLKKRQIF